MGVKCRRGYSLLESTIKTALIGAGLGLASPLGTAAHAFVLSRFAAEDRPFGWFPHVTAIGAGLLTALVAIWLPFLALAALLYAGQICAGSWQQFREALHDFRSSWGDEG